MSKEIAERLQKNLTDRNVWEQRQRIWYEMLHDGLARRNKPFEGAANLHLPIAENVVNKLIPYYVNSVFSRNVLANFTALFEEQGDAAAAAADCLNWKLRKESNFAKAYARAIYYMLANGRALFKTRWEQGNGGKGHVSFEAVEPLYFIGDAAADDPEEMDLYCHIKQVSVSKYRRTRQFNQDSALIELIKGGENQADLWKTQEKEFREGQNASTNKDLIVLWESYERVEEGWIVRTFSPSAPEKPVRQEFRLPLEWQGEPMQPFVSFVAQIEEAGWYAPRGAVERVAPFETYGTKMWNQKADWLEFSAKPLFTRDPQSVLTNSTNFKLKPGDVLPPGVQPATMPQPPMQMDEEINGARQLAEETGQVPDFGVTPDGDAGQGGKRTATEMQYIGSFASQGIQYRAWVSSLAEAEVYKRAWALLVANDKELTYYAAKSRKVLPEQARTDNFLVEPDATPDSWNKTQRIQRSVSRFQMFKGHPNINQEELAKSVLEDDDPRLVKRLFLSSGSKAANEAEDEAIEIGILLEGFPAAAMPGEDHVTRLRILFGKLQQLSMMSTPRTPEEQARMLIGRQRMQEHIAQHMALLAQENPALAKQFKAAVGVMEGGGGAGGPAGAPGGPGAMAGGPTMTGDSGGGGAASGSMVLPGAGTPGFMGGGAPGVQAGRPALV